MIMYLFYSYTVTVTYISGELNMATQIEVDIACEIMRTVERLQLPFILDDITEGRGNCFPLAVIAQCRRKEIFRNLTPELQIMVERNDSTSLRMAVKQFMMTIALCSYKASIINIYCKLPLLSYKKNPINS